MLKEIGGIHSFFYYYGKVHLSVNLYQYIRAGLENSEIIHLYVDSDTLKIVRNFNMADLSKETVKYVSLKNDIKECNKNITAITEKNNIRWIIKVDHSLDETDQQNFIQFESKVTDIIKGTNNSLLCLYDFEKYLNDKNRVYPENFHSYQLNEFKIKNII